MTNIFTNFVPNKVIPVGDREPPWMTKNIKKLLKDKSKLYKEYIKNGRKKGDYEKFLNMTTNITTDILNSKKNYFVNLAEELCNPKLNRKTYWSILKPFTNGEKVSILPPLLENDHIVINFNEKASHLNYFFLQINAL